MIKAGIIGGTGYTAGELVRLLVNHPEAELRWISSTSQAGKRVDSVHQGLTGDTDLVFSSSTPLDDIDVLFMCTPHGFSKPFLEQHKAQVPDNLRIIDLSQDFRIDDGTHDFIYGLPELNRHWLSQPGCRHVANPGCFATALQLALLPLAQARMLKGDVHITAVTGSTGAGAKPGPTKHYSWRNDNLSVYKPFRHQHLAEVGQSLRQLQGDLPGEIDFIPMRGPFSRGILAAVYTRCEASLDELKELYQSYYEGHSFTTVTDKEVDLKDVVNTNKCLLHLDKIDGKLLVTSVIDNLLKGASGTAVHNMNLLFGLPERTGLRLKASAF